MNKDKVIKRALESIMFVFIIIILTFMMFLPARDNIDTDKHYFNETIIGSNIQGTCKDDKYYYGYTLENLQLTSDKNIDTPLDFDLTFEGLFKQRGHCGPKDIIIKDIDILKTFKTYIKINDNEFNTTSSIFESTNTNKTKFTLKGLTLKDKDNTDITNFNISFKFITLEKHFSNDNYGVYMGGNKYVKTFTNFNYISTGGPRPDKPKVPRPTPIGFRPDNDTFPKPEVPIEPEVPVKPEEGISGIEVALITTGVLIAIVLMIIVGFSIWDNKKPIEQQRIPRSKHYLDTKTDKELELIITAPTNKHTKDKAKEILDNRKNNNA